MMGIEPLVGCQVGIEPDGVGIEPLCMAANWELNPMIGIEPLMMSEIISNDVWLDIAIIRGQWCLACRFHQSGARMTPKYALSDTPAATIFKKSDIIGARRELNPRPLVP